MKQIDSFLGEKSLATILTALVFFVAILFADVMYLQLVWRVVDPAWQILAIAGAFALGASVLLLPWKLKSGEIKPGNQRTVTMAVLILEFLLMVFNVVLAFAEKSGQAHAGMLQLYSTYIMPATPVLVAGGILLIWLSDPLDIASIQETKLTTARHIQRLNLRAGVEMEVIKAIGEYAQSDDVKMIIRHEAAEQAVALAREVLGVSGTKALPQPVAIPTTPPINPVQVPQPKPAYTLQSLFDSFGVRGGAEARAMLEKYHIRDPRYAFLTFRSGGKIPADLSRDQFDALWDELMAPSNEHNNNNDVAEDIDESRWESLYLNNGNGNHPNR